MRISSRNTTQGGGSGGLQSVLQQYGTITVGNTDFPITVNGGVLPASDEGILFQTATGPIFPGGGFGQYTVDRVSTPNRLILNTPAFTNLDVMVQLIY